MLSSGFWKEENDPRVLIMLAVSVLVLAGCGYFFDSDWLTLLYLVPTALAAPRLSRREILAAALICAFLRIIFVGRLLNFEALGHLAEAFILCAAVGLFVSELRSSRSNAKKQADLLDAAKLEARMLVESSPAAVITADGDGTILLANEAARQLLGFENEAAAKMERITDYVPVLKNVFKSNQLGTFNRTVLEGSAKNRAGDAFFVQMWISSYQSAGGRRFAAIFSDATEILRDREEVGLRQLLTSSQIIAGAVSHEIRNLSATASATYSNLQRKMDLSQDPDFTALGTLIAGMRQIASSEIPSFEERTMGVNIAGLLDELRIVVASAFEDDQIELCWEVGNSLPNVRADRSALLQVLLNLVQNAGRAVLGRTGAVVRITAYQLEGNVIVSVLDNGPGLSKPEKVFQPFQPGAASSGLGLYVSRAIVRTFGGELAFDKRSAGACFLVHLAPLALEETRP